jgi:hypothetical protein
MTSDLLELLWVLEATLAEYPEQAKLLGEIVTGECFSESELRLEPNAAFSSPSSREALFDLDDPELQGRPSP